MRAVRKAHRLLAVSTIAMAILPALSACSKEPSAQAAETDLLGELASYRAIYDMKRNGEAWASAVVTLTPVRYQGKDAYRHAFVLRFQDDSVIDETVFAADDFSLLTKYINAGFGDDLAWNLFAIRDGSLRGATVYADARPAEAYEAAAPADASSGAAFNLIMNGLAEGRTLTTASADVGVTYDTTLTVEAEEQIETASGETVMAWRVEQQTSLQPGVKSYFWLRDTPPYMLVQEAPAAGITWSLRDFHTFE